MRKAAGSIAIMIFVVAAFIAVDGQTRRKSRPKPRATPVPTLTGAEIISQAGDLQDPSQPLAGQPVPDATPKPLSQTALRLNNIDARLQRMETQGGADPDAKQKRMLLNLDILNRAEQRADNLRKQVFEMIEKQNSVEKRLEEIAYEIQPEVIERQLQLGGSLRPEEVRENRRKQLASEQTNLQALLSQVQGTRASLEASLAKADDMVEKLRAKLEKDIDETFLKDDQPDKPDD